MDEIRKCADEILTRIPEAPETAVILGSGLGALKPDEIYLSIPFEEVSVFPHSHIQGHSDMLMFGSISSKPVMLISGRFHYYEGFTMKQVSSPVYLSAALGIKNLIITNACGGIRSTFHPGDLMLITDFINTVGNNPLIGENDCSIGERFPDMSEPYDPKLIQIAEKTAGEIGQKYQKGVYALFSGPCYETKAEIRALAAIGADAVGMSTVPETIAANYLKMKALGISCITNMATGLSDRRHSHEEILAEAELTEKYLSLWIRKIIAAID